MEFTILNKNGYYIKKSNYLTQINNIKEDLTVKPFLFKNKLNITYPIYCENDEYLIVPKFYGIEKFGEPNIDNIIKGTNINVNFKEKLREPQKILMDKIITYINNKRGGIICLPCGSGKTVMGLYLHCHYKVKTLIVVHKSFLLNQWVERAKQFTDSKIGIIRQNKIDVEGKDIVIGMLQSISTNKYNSDIFKDFGLVIMDEAHHAPSKYFSKSLPIISSNITIGLSATPKRADKTEKILYWFFGEIIHQPEIIKNNNIEVNLVLFGLDNHPKYKEFKLYNGEINRQLTINKIITIGRRNIVIIDIILKHITENNRKIIVLSDRISHLELLKKRLDTYNLTSSSYYIGGMNIKELKKSEEARVIFASYSMASEGLDIPDLNTLIMATPRKTVEQSIGRITRKINTDVKPIVYDIIDNLPSFINQSRCRKRFYATMGFCVKSSSGIENNIEYNIENNLDLDFID